MGVTQPFDVVVIGSGAGGAAVAWGLVSKGIKVLMLEAGPRFTAHEDYPQDMPDWERKSFPAKSGSRATVTYGDLGALQARDKDLARRDAVPGQGGAHAGPSRLAAAQGYSHVLGVGGSTLHYVGEAHRLHPDAFRLQSLTGEGADWPIDYAELEPYYAQIEQTIGVAGKSAGPERWQSQTYPMQAHPVSPGGAALMQAGSQIGRSWQINPRAVNSRTFQDRPPCNYCGQCSRGCPIGDKASMDVSLLRRAEATGLLTILDQAVVQKLELGANGAVASVQFSHQGSLKTLETPQVVLAAGAVHTPRLLLMSSSAEQPNGLANGSGHVGRHFMETLSWRSAGLSPELRNSHKGLPADVTDWGMARPNARTVGAGGYKLTHTTLDTGLTGPISYATRMLRGFGPEWKAQMRQSFGSALAVSAVGQVVPDERSRVTLDPEVKDANGLPVAQIHSVLTENSLQQLREMQQACRDVMTAAGVEIREESSSWDEFSATHVFGTARMAQDATQGVVNSVGQSFDHSNLWIADASVFPTSGAGEAPSLTIMALALRTAEAIAQRAR